MAPVATYFTINESTNSTISNSSSTIHVKAMDTIHYTLYYGTFIHTPELNELEINFNTLVGVNSEGIIDFIEKEYHPNNHNNKSPIEYFIDCYYNDDDNDNTQGRRRGRGRRDYRHFEFIDYSHDLGKFFIPGFIDTHIHASQFPNCGIGLGIPLLKWLKEYTFPLEEKFTKENINLTIDIYSKIIEKTLNNGTTCASYFTTIDSFTSKIFSELLLIKGQRGFVGKVCMDHNEPYPNYEESLTDCIESMNEVINYIEDLNPKNEQLIIPIITPRFAPVCSRDLLKYLGNLSKSKKLPIQTHISENKDEIKLVNELFPDCDNYATVYDKHNLLNSNTILAHSIHLNKKERELIKFKNCSISHCPTSNTFISSGEAPIYNYLYHDKINVSLGTDVSGGFDCSILQIIKHSILVSHHLSMKKDQDQKISIKDGIYMATMGGAKAIGFQDILGSFEIGKKFDTQLIDLNFKNSNVDVFNWQLPNLDQDNNNKYDKMNDLLSKWIFTGDDRNCIKVWCNGRLIINKEKSNHRDDRWIIN